MAFHIGLARTRAPHPSRLMLVAVGLSLGGCGAGNGDSATAPAPDPTGAAPTTATSAAPVPGGMAISLVDGNAFDPASLSVGVGDTVTWENTSGSIHTVTDDPDNPLGRVHVLPDGAATFNSGNLAPGAVFEVTFTVPGTYEYSCMLHQSMSGSITVN